MDDLLEKMSLSIEKVRQNQEQTMKMVCEISARMHLAQIPAGNAAPGSPRFTVSMHQPRGPELRLHAPCGDSYPLLDDLPALETKGTQASSNDGYNSSEAEDVDAAAKAAAAAATAEDDSTAKKRRAAMRLSNRTRDLLRETAKEGSTAPEPGSSKPTSREAIKLALTRVVHGTYYPFVMGVILFTNMVFIGLEVQFLVDGKDSTWLYIVSIFYCITYIIDIVLQLLAFGRMSFCDGWFIFDFALVVLHFINVGLYKPIAGHTSGTFFDRVMVIRIFRVLRLLRSLRLLKQFRTMWSMVYGLLKSFSTLLSALALIGVTLFAFSCLGVELVTLDDTSFAGADLQAIVNANFGSLFQTLLFLVQFVTCDSIAAVYVPLIKAKPILAFYFLALLLIVSIALMNLVLANIVEQALASAHSDQELEIKIRGERIREMAPILEDIFKSLDIEDKNVLTLEQLVEIDMSQLPPDMQECFNLDSVADLFLLLDSDCSGEVEKEEFLEGFMSFCISEEPAASVHTRKVMKLLRLQMIQVAENFEEVRSDLRKITRVVNSRRF